MSLPDALLSRCSAKLSRSNRKRSTDIQSNTLRQLNAALIAVTGEAVGGH